MKRETIFPVGPYEPRLYVSKPFVIPDECTRIALCSEQYNWPEGVICVHAELFINYRPAHKQKWELLFGYDAPGLKDANVSRVERAVKPYDLKWGRVEIQVLRPLDTFFYVEYLP